MQAAPTPPLDLLDDLRSSLARFQDLAVSRRHGIRVVARHESPSGLGFLEVAVLRSAEGTP